MARRLREIPLQVLHRMVRGLLALNTPQVVALFVALAVMVSTLLVWAIDLIWDGRINAELQFAGVVVPFFDGLLVVGLLVAVLGELRSEVERRRVAEARTSNLNAVLEARVRQSTEQLRSTQDELVRSEKLALLGQVADTVGHELRNPLGVMNNAVYYLQTVLPDTDASVKEYLGIIKDEIGVADRIVSGLLDAVRTKPPRCDLVALAGLMQQALRKCQIPSTIAVQLDVPASMPLVRVDPVQIEQVFWNLITNAVESMPRGGVLAITVKEDGSGQAVDVSIRDSGGGIAAEHVGKLFQPLFTTKARRVGLGLAVVRNLTQANGGRVRVESVPEQGSVFTVTLPTGSAT